MDIETIHERALAAAITAGQARLDARAAVTHERPPIAEGAWAFLLISDSAEEVAPFQLVQVLSSRPASDGLCVAAEILDGALPTFLASARDLVSEDPSAFTVRVGRREYLLECGS